MLLLRPSLFDLNAVDLVGLATLRRALERAVDEDRIIDPDALQVYRNAVDYFARHPRASA